MNADPHPWATELDTLYAHAWHRLIRGVHDRHAPARHPTLATVSPKGWPEARTVVLRAADRFASRLEIHTNLYSPKIADLMATPIAALHVWDSRSRLQIRLQADVVITHGAQIASIWSAMPELSRMAYSRDAVPGQTIGAALAYRSTPDPAAYAVLHLDLHTMDLLHLGTHHRRAQFTRERNWAGCWLAP